MPDRVPAPRVEALLAEFREAEAPPFEHVTVPPARDAAWVYADLQGPGLEVASVTHRFVTRPPADLPVRIYTPEGDGPIPARVHCHGSGLHAEIAREVRAALHRGAPG